jgi:hypothetical protein
LKLKKIGRTQVEKTNVSDNILGDPIKQRLLCIKKASAAVIKNKKFY